MKTKIRELRKAHKLSQEELADAVGTTRQTITSIEVGKYTASLPLAYKIARFFGLTIEEVDEGGTFLCLGTGYGWFVLCKLEEM